MPRVHAGLAADRAGCRDLPLIPIRLGAILQVSSDRAPMPRGGKFTTRRNAPSSSGADMGLR
jgi:hypothetical protein